MNSNTSQGELRNSWVTNQLVRAIGRIGEICPRPSSTPASVPISMVRKADDQVQQETLGDQQRQPAPQRVHRLPVV